MIFLISFRILLPVDPFLFSRSQISSILFLNLKYSEVSIVFTSSIQL
uniref:Uncharacterized protein n=1 Tax=Myoviridae sp. ctBtT5 TaxID=2825048 RepID=A0A8S5Q084_9CAUD|nr:MAG TPA: hypothetical protein [Myoviridae sp. ctBtT5]